MDYSALLKGEESKRFQAFLTACCIVHDCFFTAMCPDLTPMILLLNMFAFPWDFKDEFGLYFS